MPFCKRDLILLPVAMSLLMFFPRPGFFVYAGEPEPINVTASIETQISQLEERYGFEICWQADCLPTQTGILFVAAQQKDYPTVEKFLDRLAVELSKYPPSFSPRSRLQTVVLAKRQFYGEKPAEGVCQLSTHMILFDFLRQEDNPAVQEHNIHHELYHLMEAETPYYWTSELWEALNEKGFEYKEQRQVKPGDNPLNYLAPALPGFVTYYAMTSPFEDRAETFACLMVKPQNKLIHRWARKDKILNEKIERIKTFAQEFCPQMDKSFWGKIF